MRLKRRSWNKLDTAGKAFPSTIMKSDTRTFRYACELKEEVDPEILQMALDNTLEEFPTFLGVIRRGFFWYYMEETNLRPVVHEDDKPPCRDIYFSGRRNLLFEVTYYKNRINFEAFHALTDGTGAIYFLQYLITNYLFLKHPKELEGMQITPSNRSSAYGKGEDSFDKYYQKTGLKFKKRERAFHLKGERMDNDGIIVIEGMMSVKKVATEAKKYGATITTFLAAIYIEAIMDDMLMRRRKQPIVLNVPVNLRNYFPSETSRNFFEVFDVRYKPSEHDGSFEGIIDTITAEFKEKLTKENLAKSLNATSALDHNLFIRVQPLSIKDIAVRLGRIKRDKGVTSYLSNVGPIRMPEEIADYIDHFHAFMATLNMQMVICSYGDKLSIGITTAFPRNEVPKRFFRRLTDLGIDIMIDSNDFDVEEG